MPGNLRAAVEDGLLLPDYYAPIQGILVTRAGHVRLRDTSTPDVHEGPGGAGGDARPRGTTGARPFTPASTP